MRKIIFLFALFLTGCGVSDNEVALKQAQAALEANRGLNAAVNWLGLSNAAMNAIMLVLSLAVMTAVVVGSYIALVHFGLVAAPEKAPTARGKRSKKALAVTGNPLDAISMEDAQKLAVLAQVKQAGLDVSALFPGLSARQAPPPIQYNEPMYGPQQPSRLPPPQRPTDREW